MRKIYLLLISVVMAAMANAQLSGTKNIPGDYANLAAAITDLNTVGVGAGGVTLNLIAGNPQTAPAGGYPVTATGILANQIIIQGNGNIITASAALTVGNLNDAIFKLIGADYVTIKDFIMQENAANTTTAAATNNMTEWGVALLYVSTTNGAQNNTIQNNTIDLVRTYQNTFGIYSNSTHSATDVSTSATATTTAGGNSGLKIYSNIITDINTGIVVVGPTASADKNDGLDIGGTAPTGNTITNYGTTSTISGYANIANVLSLVSGILVTSTKNLNISFNIVTSSNGGVTSGTLLLGINVRNIGDSYTGTFTNTINNNTVSVRSGVPTGQIIGIFNGSGSATSTINVNNNDFNNCGHTVAASGKISFIIQGGEYLNTNINNNTFTNLSMNTTGSVTFISNNNSQPANAVCNVNNNSIVTAFNKTGAGGTVQFYYGSGGSPTTATETNTGNNFSNITVTGATTIEGWQSTDGLTTSPYGPGKTITNNTFTNITGGTSAITILTVGNSNDGNATNNVSGNTINNITGAGAITGIIVYRGRQNFFSNIINTLSTTGAAAVTGFSVPFSGAQDFYKNKIFNLNGSNAGTTINGILISGSSTDQKVNIYNNLIGDLQASSASAADAIRGISIIATGTTSTYNVSFNSIYLNATSFGPVFGSSGIFHTTSTLSTTATLNLRNNIIVNNSTPSGTGLTVAYRRSSTTLTNYASASNNNLFYAGTPGANNLIFFDGTNSDQTLAAYKARVSPGDASSVTENPPFLSTTGASVNFLHINSSVSTQVESGALPIGGITNDYDGDTRNGLTPDTGADEFTSSPLSVTLLNFSGYKQGSVNILRWTTAQETNNLGFEVHRSVDGINYTSIGFVNSLAPGGISSQLNYSFTDINPVNNKQYYRLRQVDIDSRSKFSGIVLIKGDKPVTLTIYGLFPNPASNIVNVIVATPDRSVVTLVVTDISGRTLTQKVANVETGSNTIPLDISRLTNGSYLVKLVCKDNCEAALIKFIKQ